MSTDQNKEYRLILEPDNHAGNPRQDCDWLGTMACWNGRYTLGDEQPGGNPTDWRRELACQFDDDLLDRADRHFNRLERARPRSSFEELAGENDSYLRDQVDALLDKHYIMLPLFLYDHSGITMSTGAFSCPWDSGQVGWIYVSKDKLKSEFGWKRMSPQREDFAKQILKTEVDVYDQYLRGEVWGFIVESRPEGSEDDDAWEDEDSCWGFYGDDPKTNGIAGHLSDEQQHLLDTFERRYP